MRFLSDQVALSRRPDPDRGATQTSDGGRSSHAVPRGTFARERRRARARPGPRAVYRCGCLRAGSAAPSATRGRRGRAPTRTRPASTLGTITAHRHRRARALLPALIVSAYLAPASPAPSAAWAANAPDRAGDLPAASRRRARVSYSRSPSSPVSSTSGRPPEESTTSSGATATEPRLPADVSHSSDAARRPRMHVELLQAGPATNADDPGRFPGHQPQPAGPDGLAAQNLLELSKLESGLLRLDLGRRTSARRSKSAVRKRTRPRATSVISSSAAGVPPCACATTPQRIGQVVANLVATPSSSAAGGRGHREVAPHRDGARLVVRDTGSASTPRRSPTSSSASTAARGQRGARVRSGSRPWPSPSRSWTCTAAGSPGRACRRGERR